MVVPFMEAQGRRLVVDVPDVVQLRGVADDLRDMIRNLLDNALIHGHGTVIARIRPTAEASGEINIEVMEAGDGVAPGHDALIFERFRKLDAESPGSALGLAIVRHVARAHGGAARFLTGRGHVAARRTVNTLPRRHGCRGPLGRG
jgi:two-component system sensor histidine kinase QseC